MASPDHAPRILGGEFRGRALAVAPGLLTRPLRALARRSLFDVLGERAAAGAVLDLFAGSGAIGLEALSRGAPRAVLVEQARPAQVAIAATIERFRCGDRALLVRAPAIEFAATAEPGSFHFIYLGPPYRAFRGEERAELDRLLARIAGLLHRDGVAVLETPAEIALPRAPGLAARDRREYGDTVLHFLERDP